MSVILVGSVPYLSACKDKYEWEPVTIFTIGDELCIRFHKNINTYSYNLSDGVLTEYLGYGARKSDTIWSSEETVQDIELVEDGEVVKPERTLTTLANADLNCWFTRPRKTHDVSPVIRWELRYRGNRVQTFVSFHKPIPVQRGEDIYILVGTSYDGYDIYKLNKESPPNT